MVVKNAYQPNLQKKIADLRIFYSHKFKFIFRSFPSTFHPYLTKIVLLLLTSLKKHKHPNTSNCFPPVSISIIVTIRLMRSYDAEFDTIIPIMFTVEFD